MKLFDFYIKLLKERPAWLSVLVAGYIMAFVMYFFFLQRQRLERELKKDVSMIMVELENENADLKKLVATLSEARGQPRLFKPITFEETWENNEKKKEVQRILEYADFALSKDDIKRAMVLYEEALTVQETFSAKYALGRLEYLSGNINSCVQHWSQIIEADTEGLYPLLRFYLAVAFHEQGQEKQSREYLQKYLSLAEVQSSSQSPTG